MPGLKDPHRGQTVAPCGTEAAYQRHRRHKEDACAACLAAHAEHRRTHKASSIPGTNRKPIAHGTAPGYQQHIYRSEKACQACIEAHRVQQRARYRLRAEAKWARLADAQSGGAR